MTIRIFRPTSKAQFGPHQVVVSAVRIEANNRIMYEIIFWMCGQRLTQWVNDFELEEIEATTEDIDVTFK